MAPEMATPFKVLLANLWLTQPLVEKALSQTKEIAVSTKTTAAVTVIEGSRHIRIIFSISCRI
jgi:hypothetical protein